MQTFKIMGSVKEYAWGTKDYITQLTGIRRNGPVAEYWLGTHPLGEAVDADGETLSRHIGHKLPFLFKVLSISTPLAIQCHPTKAQAKEGYARESLSPLADEDRNYPDDNEKTEAVIALTDFTGMYGFRPMEETKANLKEYVPALYRRMEDLVSYRDLYLRLLALSEKEVRVVLDELREKLRGTTIPQSLHLSMSELCLWCLTLYPEDIFVLSPLWMNVAHLKAGESLFIPAGVVHAYCKGNCLEIMTTSDNMVRLGLTRRHTDSEEFLAIACFGETKPAKALQKESSGCHSYGYPPALFSLLRLEEGEHVFSEREDGILFVTEGKTDVTEGEETLSLNKGEAIYVPSSSALSVRVRGEAFFSFGGKVQ